MAPRLVRSGKQDNQTWTVCLIEEHFYRLMFDVGDM
jgi:hypothetical protein